MSVTADVDGQIQQVTNFDDLLNTSFQGTINAVCWQRDLTGDFAEIVDKLETTEDLTTITPDTLRDLSLSEVGDRARTTILNDLQRLSEAGDAPVLNLISAYERDDSYPLLPTDVYSFHVDRAPVAGATLLCTYYGQSSDILPNSQALQKIRIPDVRRELRKLYDGPEAGFEDFLAEYFFDLHYQPAPAATPINLGVGNLWRLAIDHPGSKVLPCVHRAPAETDGLRRLLLIC